MVAELLLDVVVVEPGGIQTEWGNIAMKNLKKIIFEYSQNPDRHSQHLIISNVEMLLDYCIRYYDR